MSAMVDYAAIATAVITVLAGLFAGLRWLIRAYLRELVPNGGSSMADRVNRIEDRVNALYDHLITTK